MKYYICEHCGNIIEFAKDNGVPVMCCGQKMTELVPGTSDGAVEKHVPVYERVEDEIVVRVGETEHPMEKEHYIMWIMQVTETKATRVTLYPEQETTTRFPYIPNSTLYAYCNKHGLWKNIVK